MPFRNIPETYLNEPFTMPYLALLRLLYRKITTHRVNTE
jgi:hypothetical protein